VNVSPNYPIGNERHSSLEPPGSFDVSLDFREGFDSEVIKGSNKSLLDDRLLSRR
jgi:hypothetical protein